MFVDITLYSVLSLSFCLLTRVKERQARQVLAAVDRLLPLTSRLLKCYDNIIIMSEMNCALRGLHHVDDPQERFPSIELFTKAYTR